MRILFISDNFPPETNAPASRTFEHMLHWVARGFEVTVITCAPNFPAGKVYDGYENKWRSVSDVSGIRVVRVKTFITSNDGFWIRILDYVSFMFSAFMFGIFEKRPDVVIGTSPQFFSAVCAWMLSTVKRKPFVFELRDLWPASIVTVGAMKPGLAIRTLEKLELFLYRRARLIISVTESFREDLVTRGIDGGKIHVIRNGVDLSRFEPRDACHDLANRVGVDRKFVIAYFGTHGMAHALENVLEAAARLVQESRITFLFVGDGARKKSLVAMAESMNLKNVVFHDPVPKEVMPDLWSICDVALVHLRDDPVFSTVIPSKVFEAFGMGKPVLIAQPRGEAADIVCSAGAGEWVPANDADRLAETILRWYRDPKRVQQYEESARTAALCYSREKMAISMAEVLEQLR